MYDGVCHFVTQFILISNVWFSSFRIDSTIVSSHFLHTCPEHTFSSSFCVKEVYSDKALSNIHQGTVSIKMPCYQFSNIHFNTLRPRQNGRHSADGTFKFIFLNQENIWIPIKISLKFVPKGPININPSMVQIMVWRRAGAKPLSEPMLVSLLTQICVTRPQWVKGRTTISSLNGIPLHG